jgi:serine/threonine protein kinase/tetratricopeptide (TPR) repeat protein
MTAIEDQAKSVFLEALERASDQWPTLLDEKCGGNAELRARVEQLLYAHRAMGGIGDRSAPEQPQPTLVPIREGPGTMIGPYKLLQEIGEGGFGLVYMAEQEKPVRRTVAVKIIKPGMDSAQVIARFESERQALALMDHPNVAKVLDAGTTKSGHPYFVMELVKGVPVTEFCDKNHLPPEERLKLFLEVCHAIQHAHHKGVIHRDIKPTNVMVTLHDGIPVVKVIDFGVAKATAQKLTERTLFTAYGQMVGTPAYMSPEQAEMSGLDVDTRTDIYSLGVLLYELLTGTTPLKVERLREVGYTEMQRIIREEEAPRPSTRLSSLKGAATILAGNRGLDVKRLVKLLSGDLDWIVMKALEKDRNRRYATPGNLAEDIERYLRHDAIVARPPSTAYRMKKFAQRNRVAVLTTVVVATTLVAGSAIATWQAVRATRAEGQALKAEAEAQRDRAEAEDQRKVAERREAEARDNERKARVAEAAAKESDATANEVLDFLKNNIFAAARPPLEKSGLGREVTLRKALDSAEPKIATAFAARPRVEAQLRYMLGVTYNVLDEDPLAQAQLERAYTLAKERYGLDDKFTGDVEYHLANNYTHAGRTAEGIQILEQTLKRRRETLGPQHPMTVESLSNLIWEYAQSSRLEDAKKLATEFLQTRVKGGQSTEGANQITRVANAYDLAGRPDEAARVIEESLPRLTAKVGPEAPDVLDLIHNLSFYYNKLGRTEEAVTLLEPAYRRALSTLGPINGVTLGLLKNLTAYIGNLGRNEEVVRILEPALPALRHELGPANRRTTPFVIDLARAYESLGRYGDGVKLLEETMAAIPEKSRVAGNWDWLQEELIACYLKHENRGGAKRILADWEHHVRSQYPAESLELSGQLMRLGDTTRDMQLLEEAERLYREALNIRKRKEPGGWRVASAKVCLGVALVEQKQFTEAEQLLDTGCEELKARWQELNGQTKSFLLGGWSRLAKLYEDTGRREKAVATYRQATDFWEKRNLTGTESLYNDACLHSLTAAALKSMPGSEAIQLAAAESDRALALLKQCVAAGFKDFSQINRDHDLDVLRERKDFKDLLAAIKPKSLSESGKRATVGSAK